jgi:hypothetical protein
MEAFADSKKEPQKIIYINEHKIFEFIKTIIIGYNVQEKMLFDTCYIGQEEKNSKKNKESFKELIKNF